MTDAAKQKIGFADLHLHTNLSDGSLTPLEVVKLSKRKGLRCISVTDHDTLASYSATKPYADELNHSWNRSFFRLARTRCPHSRLFL